MQTFGLQFAANAQGSLTLSAVTAGSPAAQAGLSSGDTITAVNGRSVASLAQFNSLLQQSPNQAASVTFTHQGETETIPFSLTAAGSALVAP